MAEAVFDLGRELGHGCGVGGHEEDRIVAKSIGSCGGRGDQSFTASFGLALAPIGADRADRAAEAGPTLFCLGKGLKFVKQKLAATLVVECRAPVAG